MGTIPFPKDAEAQWNGLILGPHNFPGVWSVDGASERELTVKARKGADLGRVRDRGYKNAPLTLTGTISDAEQWDEMQAIIRDIHPRKKGKDRDPYQISHPGASYLGVNHVYIKRIVAPQALPNGMIQLRIEVLEWSNTPKTLKKRVGKPKSAGETDVATTIGAVFDDPITGQSRLNTGIAMPSAQAEAFLGI